MFYDDFTLQGKINLISPLRDIFPPHANDIKNLSLALQYLGFFDATTTLLGALMPGSSFYEAIRKCQGQWGDISEDVVLTNASATIINLRKALRSRYSEHQDVYTFERLGFEEIRIALAVLRVKEIIRLFKDKGWGLAAEGMERFLYRRGDWELSEYEIRSFAATREMEQEALGNFVNKGLKGDTQNSAWNDELKELQIGVTRQMNTVDFWNAKRDGYIFEPLEDLNFFFLFASVQIRADCIATLTKTSGNNIKYEVTLECSLEDVYDFRSTGNLTKNTILDQIAQLIFGGKIYEPCLLLEDKGVAYPFNLSARWTAGTFMGEKDV